MRLKINAIPGRHSLLNLDYVQLVRAPSFTRRSYDNSISIQPAHIVL
ncbi:Integrase [Brochothrix thermosphacta]